jgi:hypothetical protein
MGDKKMKHKIVKIASLMLCLVMIAPVVKASSFQKRLHSEIQDLYKIIENNPAAI